MVVKPNQKLAKPGPQRSGRRLRRMWTSIFVATLVTYIEHVHGVGILAVGRPGQPLPDRHAPDSHSAAGTS